MRTAHAWTLCLAAWALTAGVSCAEEVALAPSRPGSSSPAGGDWPQFRGPNRDDKSEAKGLLQKFPEGGPKLLWTQRQIGRGYSGPAVVGNRVYIGGTDGEKSEAILCMDLKDGKALWGTPIGEFYNNGWGGGPRSTPTVDGDFVYMLSGKGDLACVKAKDGTKVWSKNLVSDFGGNVEAWGYSESVLIDGDKVICTPGGKNTMAALNKKTGAPIWMSTGVQEAAQYASPIKATVDGVTFYMTLTKGGVIAVNAENGEFLWKFQKPGNGVASIPTPIFFDDAYVYATSGYGTGGGTVKLTGSSGKLDAEEIFFNKDMVNHHGGVVLLDGKIYGHSDGKGWICQDPLKGEVVWRERGFKKGSITYADGRFYCYSEDDGTCVLIAASPAAWEEHGRFTIPEETKLDRGQGKIWTHPTVAQGRLFLRDQDLLFCFDVTAD
ncbi:MAG TPA: PQQ-binding-like beta-propeller repeat protein [Pirellulales bacterium]